MKSLLKDLMKLDLSKFAPVEEKRKSQKDSWNVNVSVNWDGSHA